MAKHRPKIEIESVEPVISRYANFIQAESGAFEVRVRFCEIVGTAPETIKVRETARIIMVPAQWRAMLKVLTDVLDKHDAQMATLTRSKEAKPAT